MAKNKKILFVDDDASQREVAEYRLREAGFNVSTASDGLAAFEAFTKETPHIIITDLRMPVMDGMELMAKVKSISPSTIFIVITAHGTIDSAVEAMKVGAYDYLQKPFNAQDLILCVKKAARMSDLEEENTYLREVAADRYRFETMIGSSKKMSDMFRTAMRVAATNSTALLLGESGTGKELLARAIHFNSQRKDGPFVAVNTAAIPETLVDSELFGHEKGSFTGAVARKKGRFEQASGGTVFLDEIGDMRQEIQARLLRVIQEKTVDTVGGSEPVSVDVRIIAATNQDLEKMVEAGEFREDLFYRLNVVPITVPPLRERADDIPLLLSHFIKKYSADAGGAEPLRFADEAIRILHAYPWPGNVRELENLVERLVAVSSGEVTAADLPEKMRRPAGMAGRLFVDLPDDGISLYDVEKAAIERALEKNEFNQSKTARFLNIPRNTLLYRMEKLGIEKK